MSAISHDCRPLDRSVYGVRGLTDTLRRFVEREMVVFWKDAERAEAKYLFHLMPPYKLVNARTSERIDMLRDLEREKPHQLAFIGQDNMKNHNWRITVIDCETLNEDVPGAILSIPAAAIDALITERNKVSVILERWNIGTRREADYKVTLFG